MKDTRPVEVSGNALRDLSNKMREWSGWRDATLVLGKPEVSPFASTNHLAHQFTINVDVLTRNPNRVLNVMTPYRYRQEVILTGAMLHEAGHARYSRWLNRDGSAPDLHSDGSEATDATIDLARLMEEPRIEGFVAKDAATLGADGFEWTMRASAAELIPTTPADLTNTAQAV